MRLYLNMKSCISNELFVCSGVIVVTNICQDLRSQRLLCVSTPVPVTSATLVELGYDQSVGVYAAINKYQAAREYEDVQTEDRHDGKLVASFRRGLPARGGRVHPLVPRATLPLPPLFFTCTLLFDLTAVAQTLLGEGVPVLVPARLSVAAPQLLPTASRIFFLAALFRKFVRVMPILVLVCVNVLPFAVAGE